MAERRMFARTLIDSDAFLDMPPAAQALYFHIGMRADDDGFLNCPNKVARAIGATPADLEELISHGFLIRFPSGVVVVKHWRISNHVQRDRYHPTVYTEEKSALTVKANEAYTLTGCDQPVTNLDTDCIQPVNRMDTEYSIVESSKVKTSKEKKINRGAKRFAKPTPDDVEQYAASINFKIDGNLFCDYYDQKGWTIGKASAPMRDWKAAVRTWKARHPEAVTAEPVTVPPTMSDDEWWAAIKTDPASIF